MKLWTGKTLPDRKAERHEFVRQQLAAAGIEKPDTSKVRVYPVPPGDLDAPPREHLRYRARDKDPDGIEREKSFPDKQKKRADDFLREVEADKREGKYIDLKATRKTFRQLAESWFRAQSSDPAKS